MHGRIKDFPFWRPSAMQGEAAALAHQGVHWAICLQMAACCIEVKIKISLQLTSLCVEKTSTYITCLIVSLNLNLRLKSIVLNCMLVSFEEMDLCTPAEYQKILNIDVWLTDKIKQFEESSKVYRVKATDSSPRIQIVNEKFIARKMNCSTLDFNTCWFGHFKF